ncbi:hypothetical protein G436_1484 [Leptospira interrogans serovar Hardjo str. Norma]|uniref:Uncharacterized protein n=1 Tax=Leptospira interrogans serovar Hardjo str. Norma TaxID=1279460 RepID=A0A0M4N7L6_LEPIR|nr:hypothetical protein G436_1484 [Leptospira interrogans serovar Hardjo str. Norma]
MNLNLTDRFLKCGNYHKLRFVYKMMWELLQTMILQTIPEIVPLENFFLGRTHVKIRFKF